ncbi:MAG: diadenylate cyclase CdaA [Oscillospiraceae bacterium]|jgi:diadenylate cyclase|nr:diadenylate cyclase CdaA [Oscillospiraceae bacterium]
MSAIESILLDLWSYIRTISVWDILDIAIIAYLIYRILMVVRKTSAGEVIKGIILLLAVVWISNLMNLNVIGYLLQQAMRMGVIILIVLFQPELRKFLEHFGTKNFRTLFSGRAKPAEDEMSVGHTVDACVELARTKTGALIVFERDIGIADYIATGTAVDSVVSVELLKTIFFPNTALHDGAVIIKNGRIVAAGCMLPMSGNANLSRDLGMRHKAGIGMSERSDAVSVIVSEETGAISVAVDGMLKRNLSRETFHKLLRNELGLSTESEGAKPRPRILKGKKS